MDSQKAVFIKPPVPAEMSLPLDVFPINRKFNYLRLPLNFPGYDKYVPVYLSSIENPGLFYIQIIGSEYSDALQALHKTMSEFYRSASKLYEMVPIDIREGISCVASWPVCTAWHRVTIMSVVSLERVQVLFVDYGNIEEISVNMLRYIRQEYMDFPMQALKSKLALLKPPNNAANWSIGGRSRFQLLCLKKVLMAKIHKIENGTLCLILCDTRGTKDIFINDWLLEQNYAEMKSEEPQPYLGPAVDLQYMQQMFQYLVINILQTAPGNVFPLSPASNFLLPQIALPVTPDVPFNFCQGNPHNIPAVINYIPPPVPCPSATPYNKDLKKEVISKNTIDKTNAITKENVLPGNSTPDQDKIVFDEKYWEDSYKQITGNTKKIKKKFIKRVKTSDAYIFHVILHESKAYVASGDISFLIWNKKSPSYLLQRLQSFPAFPDITLVKESNEELFLQLEKYSVKGIQSISNNRDSIHMFPLNIINQILNIFGHPSIALRESIKLECINFDPLSDFWKKYLDDEKLNERDDEPSGTYDSTNELDHLCLSDLKIIETGMKSRLKLLSSASPQNLEKIRELHHMLTLINKKILKIEQICEQWS